MTSSRARQCFAYMFSRPPKALCDCSHVIFGQIWTLTPAVHHFIDLGSAWYWPPLQPEEDDDLLWHHHSQAPNCRRGQYKDVEWTALTFDGRHMISKLEHFEMTGPADSLSYQQDPGPVLGSICSQVEGRERNDPRAATGDMRLPWRRRHLCLRRVNVVLTCPPRRGYNAR